MPKKIPEATKEKTCWMCKRTNQQSLEDLGKIVVDELRMDVAVNKYITPEGIAENTNKLNCLVEGSCYATMFGVDSDEELYYDIAVNVQERQFTSRGGYIHIPLCPVCRNVIKILSIQENQNQVD